MAQLVEQLIRNQQVAGSSPATSSIYTRGFPGYFLLLAAENEKQKEAEITEYRSLAF